jgi:hypothetical protein
LQAVSVRYRALRRLLFAGTPLAGERNGGGAFASAPQPAISQEIIFFTKSVVIFPEYATITNTNCEAPLISRRVRAFAFLPKAPPRRFHARFRESESQRKEMEN